MIKTKLPNFGYQVQLRSGEVEKRVQSKEQIRQLLSGIYGSTGPNGEAGFSIREGVLFDNLPKLGKPDLLSDEMMDYYVEAYAKNGIHGTRRPSTRLSCPSCLTNH